MYGCESWTIKKAECWRINASELWCWRRVPWTARRSNQSILKETNTIQWKDLMLKLQYFGHMMQRADSLKKTLTLGKIEGKRKRGQQRTRWLDSITNSRSSLRLISIESVKASSHLILSSPSPPVPNPSQHQSLFQWVNSSHEVAKVLEFQL